MDTLANEDDRPVAGLRRRFQFSLLMLLMLVTLSAALCAGATWWITLPQRTWRTFIARLEAGDIDGANALLDTSTLRVIPDDDEGFPKDQRGQMLKRSNLLAMLHETRGSPRSWTDMLQGRYRLDWHLPIAGFEVRRTKIIYISHW